MGCAFRSVRYTKVENLRSNRSTNDVSHGGRGKSHRAQAIGHAVIQQGHRVLYREALVLLEQLADATVDGTASAA